MDLSTTYMGLELKNPVIAGASNLTANVDRIKQIEEAGAAAVVIKSLFEEQIQLERFRQDDQAEHFSYRHPEMINPFPEIPELGPGEHLHWIRITKEEVEIPVIASLNATNRDTWLDYAQRLQDTGADAIELNLFASPKDKHLTGHEIEEEQLSILASLKNNLNIPVSVKLSVFYTNPLNFIFELDQEGVDGFVVFNRFFHPDIDVHEEKNTFPFNLSEPEDHLLPLRYAGLLYGEVEGDVCCSSGVFSGDDVIKMLLAGADCVQVVSTLYQNGIGHLAKIIEDVEKWMERKGYQSLAEFRGKMSRKKSHNPWIYTRAQYAKLLMKPNPLERDNNLP